MSQLIMNDFDTLLERAHLEARALLDQLERDRRRLEERCLELGKDDPLKDLTGRSAMDRAVDTVRELVAEIDGQRDDLLLDSPVIGRVDRQPFVLTATMAHRG